MHGLSLVTLQLQDHAQSATPAAFRPMHCSHSAAFLKCADEEPARCLASDRSYFGVQRMDRQNAVDTRQHVTPDRSMAPGRNSGQVEPVCLFKS